MVSGMLTSFLASCLAASTVAWLVALMRESGIRPLRGLAALIRAQPKAGRILVGAAFASAWIVAGAKPGGMRSGDGAPAVAGGTAATDSRDGDGAAATTDAGLAPVRMGTGEAFDFTPPSNATVCADWLAFGAAEDWTYLSFTNWSVRVGDGSSSRLRVHSCGWAEALPDHGASAGAKDRAPAAFMPLRAPLCIVPEANWPLIAPSLKPEPAPQSLKPLTPLTSPPLHISTSQPSLFWHCLTPSNTLLLTWLNVRYAHRADSPVSLQAEIRQGGGVDFRYSLPRPAEVADGQASNVLVGVSAGGAGWTTNALPEGVTGIRLESGLERRCAACLDTFLSRLGGLDPMSCPPGSTNTVWEHIAYTGTPDGAFTIPESTENVAVLEVSVSGSGKGVLDVGGAAFPLAGPGGAAVAAQSAVRPMSAPTPPSLRIQVPRGQTVPIYVTGDGSLSVSLSSGDFAFGVLPSLAKRILSGWINFPNTRPTPACVHDYGAESVTVTLPAGEGADGLRCEWAGPGVVNVPPRSAEIGGLNPRIEATISYTLSHPLRLFGKATGEQEVRFCPVPPDPDPDRPDPYVPEEEEEPEPESDYPYGEGGECECDREACDGSCGCCQPWSRCCGQTDPDDYAVARTNVAHMSGVLLVRDPPLFGEPIRLELPGGEPRCCPCPSHARRRVELACARRIRVADGDGAYFSIAAESVDVRVAATGPSRWPGDAYAAFATNGVISLECAHTALGVGIAREGLDLAALNALSPAFGLPVPVTTNMDAAAPITLRTDVLLQGMNVHIAFEGASAPFALWVPDTEGGGWRKAASSDGGALDVTLPAWRRMSGADGHPDPFSTEARVTAEGAGTATLVFRAWGVAGGLFVEDEARQRITAIAPCVRADIDHDGKMDASDDAARLAGRPFRFWTNGDCDKGDFAGQVSDRAPNASDLKVNGRLDLVNLFPVVVDASPFLRAWGGAAEVRLRASGDGLRFCALGEGFPSGDVLGLASKPVKTADGKPLESAALKPLGHDGLALAELAGRQTQEPVALAFEASGPAGEAEGPELVVCLGGTEAYRERLPVSITSVDGLYRYADLRGAEAGGPFLPALPGEPPNMPDAETDDRHFVFVHGYNVNAPASRLWASAMFKRLWWAGSRSRFTAVDWRGDESQRYVPTQGDTSPNYYVNVRHAFMSAPALKALCGRLPGGKVMLAHSLGNMLVSAAAVDEGLVYDRYYMLNAAVPMEAYDPEEQDDLMVDGAWKGLDPRFRASRFAGLFAATPGDFRAGLSWRGRFAGIRNAVNCHSPTEDVLANPTRKKVFGIQTEDFGGAWSKQELFKGCTLWYGVNAATFSGAEIEGGWGISAWYASNPLAYIPLSGFNAFYFRNCTREDLIENPLFTAFEDERMALTNELAFADAELRAKMLGDAIPAESFAAGRNVTRGVSDNINLQGCASDEWPKTDDDKNPIWEHSDIKNVAFFYLYKLFREFVGENQK